MLKRIYLVMLATLNVVLCAVLAAMMWASAPPTFNPIIAFLGVSFLALVALQGINGYYLEAHGRKLVSWWFPIGDLRGIPLAIKFVPLLVMWAVVGYFLYLWALWLLGY